MSLRRIALLVCCAAVTTAAYVLLDFYSLRNGPVSQRFERQWRRDVEQLEKSQKLPKSWSDLREVVLIGGTPETRKFLRQVEHPIKTKADGNHRMEILLIVWEEEGVHGVTIQYNLEDIKTKENVYELGRTLVLNKQNILEEFGL